MNKDTIITRLRQKIREQAAYIRELETRLGIVAPEIPPADTPELTYKEKIEEILKHDKKDGTRWKKQDVAQYIGKHPKMITRICKYGEEPTKADVQEKIDELYELVILQEMDEKHWIL